METPRHHRKINDREEFENHKLKEDAKIQKQKQTNNKKNEEKTIKNKKEEKK